MLSHGVRFTAQKLGRRLELIEAQIHRECCRLNAFAYQEVGRAAPYAAALAGLGETGWSTIPIGSYWGSWETDFILRTELRVPAAWRSDRPLSLVLKVGEAGDFIHPEAMVRIDGERLGACDRYHSELRLPGKFADGAPHLLELHGWTGLGGRLERGAEGRQLFMGQSLVSRPDEALRAFVATARVALGTAVELDETDIVRARLLNALDTAFLALDTRDPVAEHLPVSLDNARRVLDEALEALPAEVGPRLHTAGHAHIDLAWLWSTKQTRLKATRTFSTVDKLMEEFPDYRFTQSQPQLYDWLQSDDPELFDAVAQRVKEGRWEPTGGMWVEADCNLSGAESLARQFLLGRHYFRKTFGEGVDTPILWLPDVFGYAWSLPQLIKEAGLQYFFTIKIGWNQYNRMPFDSFWWQGLDGTRVLTHFSTAPGENPREISTYNARATPQQMLRSWTNFQQKHAQEDLFMSFGHGDGGGGPTREMLENIREMSALPVGPSVSHAFGRDFFETLERESGDRLPVWDGELYLEYHRGTYTTQARNKRNNRRAEFLLHDAELLCTMALVEDPGCAYPAEEFDRLWKLVCLNQFHDIIPGTSINEVYRHSDADYADIFASLSQVSEAALQSLGGGAGEVLLVNPTDFERQDLAFGPDLGEGAVLTGPDGATRATQRVEGGTVIDARGLGPLAALHCRVERGALPATGLSASRGHLENADLRVEFDAAGDIVRILDKRSAREVLPDGARANQFLGFEDRPQEWDAWDVDLYYEDRSWQADPATSIEVVESGPLRAALRITRRFMSSEIVQTISLGAFSPRLDFRTRIDWRERHMLLKVAFPLDILSPTATFDIQWGNVERPTHRNTSWDWARFESCAHKWVDLSEGDYGVSLLNDCKYGHDVHGSTLRLTLLRGATHPDPDADLGPHDFTYALFPHAGRWGRRTIAEAYALNDPVIVRKGGDGGTARAMPPIVRTDNPNVVIETVKRAEDGNGIIVRLYETMRTRGPVTLTASRALARALRTNLLEDETARLEPEGRAVRFDVRPFEIVTLRLVFD